MRIVTPLPFWMGYHDYCMPRGPAFQQQVSADAARFLQGSAPEKIRGKR
jgi:hypothetical protein